MTNPGIDKEPVRTEDCEVLRTPEDLIAWIESVEEQFHADDRIEKELIKKFFEEIRPLGHLARHKYLGRPGLSLRPKIGNQNYDAEIIDKSSGVESVARVEFVSTYRDYDHALRMEQLVEHGGVFMTGPPAERVGTKALGGRVSVVPGDVVHQEYLENLVATIGARMDDKLSKPYPADMIVAVVFDDWSLNPEDLPQLQAFFHDTLSKQALSKFRGLFILGASGRTFWEFGETLP